MYDRSLGWATRPEVPIPLPLGAVVAVCDLVDVVPIGRGPSPHVGDYPHEGDLIHQQGGLWLIGVNERTHGTPTRIEDQRPFGDFTPGRFAWILDNVRAVDPIPCKGTRRFGPCPVEIPG